MPLQPPVHAGSAYRVRFNNTSSGAALVSVLWVPKHGNSVPGPSERTVAASGTVELNGTVPPFNDARRMEVIVDVPDGGSGKLELFEGGKPHSEATLADDTTWKMLVEE